MVVLGLTGSIGMGKSNAAAMFRRLGYPVHDADAVVHRLLGPGGGAVAAVTRRFPAARDGDRIDRKRLGAAVFGDAAALAELEAILHPLVRASADRFLKHACAHRRPLAVLDIPLLYETGAEARCDLVVVVSAPRFVQARRVLRRPGMTRARLAAILDQQVPDREKRRRADAIISTGLSKRRTLAALARLVIGAANAPCRAWRPNSGARQRLRQRSRERRHA